MKNRISPYEAGWLTFLVEQRIATRDEAKNAMNRVAQEAIDELNRRRKAKKRARKKREDE